jgi:hypothetical protein
MSDSLEVPLALTNRIGGFTKLSRRFDAGDAASPRPGNAMRRHFTFRSRRVSDKLTLKTLAHTIGGISVPSEAAVSASAGIALRQRGDWSPLAAIVMDHRRGWGTPRREGAILNDV